MDSLIGLRGDELETAFRTLKCSRREKLAWLERYTIERHEAVLQSFRRMVAENPTRASSGDLGATGSDSEGLLEAQGTAYEVLSGMVKNMRALTQTALSFPDAGIMQRMIVDTFLRVIVKQVKDCRSKILQVPQAYREKVNEALAELEYRIEMEIAHGEELLCDQHECDHYLRWLEPIEEFLECEQDIKSEGPSKDASSADMVMEEAPDDEQQVAQLMQPDNDGESVEMLHLEYLSAEAGVNAAMDLADKALMAALGRHTKARNGYLAETPVTREEFRHALAVAQRDTKIAKAVLQKLAK
ncbi:hypothetical protein LTR56_008647 [Elasticomyces elasticus]|nr:hypothetical protein LTR56_008647 [Elasticomyces elasticus]KAK3662252.1 hypothetical protein LTR22_007017 [Elasticomyces elasticus]KAK4916723.1 hypothetical protein LTR49_015291 [Elasticomyces elasticus]KAK5768016.1 hypothetical protein LTS12_001833 [Elasticomyces elasticus]